MKLDWLDEIKEELPELLSGDAELIYTQCGYDVFKLLYQNFAGMNLYLSGKPLREAMRRYIRKRYSQSNLKELAMKLGVSERYVYKVLKEGDDD